MSVKSTLAYRVPVGVDSIEETVRFYESTAEASWDASPAATGYLKQAHCVPGKATTYSFAKLVPANDLHASRIRVAYGSPTPTTLAIAKANRVVSHETTHRVNSSGLPIVGYVVPLDHTCLLASKNSLHVVVRTGGGTLRVYERQDSGSDVAIFTAPCNAPFLTIQEFPFDFLLPLSTAGHTITVQFIGGFLETLDWMDVTYPDGGAP